MEFQQVMRIGQKEKGDSLSREDIDNYSAKYIEMFFSPDRDRLINERFGYKQALLASNFDTAELFSDVCCRHGDKQSRGGDRGGYEVRGDYTKTFGGDKNSPGKFSLQAKGYDGKGNSIDATVTANGDGTTDVNVGVKRASK